MGPLIFKKHRELFPKLPHELTHPPKVCQAGPPPPKPTTVFENFRVHSRRHSPEKWLYGVWFRYFFLLLFDFVFCIFNIHYPYSTILPRTTSEFRNGCTASRIGILFFPFWRDLFLMFRIVHLFRVTNQRNAALSLWFWVECFFVQSWVEIVFIVLLFGWFCLSRPHEPEEWLLCRLVLLLFWVGSAFLCCHG